MSWKHRIVDLLIAVWLPLPARVLRFLRYRFRYFPLSKAVMIRAGVFPVIDHYHDAFYDPATLRDLRAPRPLPAIDFNLAAQIALLEALPEAPELAALPEAPTGDRGFHLANNMFEHGDAELWYQVIGHFRPRRIIEVGSGHSTKIARLAIDRAALTDPDYRCDHVCIDPFAPDWLDSLGPRVLRQKVEATSLDLFRQLERDDILFIDSSHVIRPQGDVLFQYLHLLPVLAPGVIVHIHDVFSPRDYPDTWLRDRVYFWNEQYLVEAFLSHNTEWEILLAGNMLMHEAYDLLKSRCLHLDRDREPRSLYIRRLSPRVPGA
ncbi:MAG TPA: class I SAM-dependent methyltransferase [Caulobacter sp.]|nr:class I SAM-dependent methyltransferase [Caulobacter sp.]